jgi:hypothetical protein
MKRYITTHVRAACVAALAACLAFSGVHAAPVPPPPPPELTYADWVELVQGAALVAKVEIMEERDPRADDDEDSGKAKSHLPLGLVRVDAQVENLLKGPFDMSPRVRFMAQVPLDAKGRPWKLKRTHQLLFATRAAPPQLPTQAPPQVALLKLVRPQTLYTWDVGNEALLRRLLGALNAPDAPPRITGIESAFSVIGTLQGERETQIFLITSRQLVSLTISHPAEGAAHWALSLSDVAGDVVPPPAQESLLWYQLACHLPPEFPLEKIADKDAEERSHIIADYALVRQSLGVCAHSL